MVVEDGTLTIRAGQQVAEHDSDSTGDRARELRRAYVDAHGTVRTNVHFSSPSQAAAFATGHSCNGWAQWKMADGQPIDVFRARQNSLPQSLH